MPSLYPSAINRFFYAYDEFDAPISVALAQSYLYTRMNEASQLKKLLEWKLFTEGSMRCQIYGHTIVLAFQDSALHCGQPAGGGDFYSSNHQPGEDPEMFENLDQCLAFILATNW